MMHAISDRDASRSIELDTFSRALLDAILELAVHRGGIPSVGLADVKHWVRRRWPLPPEAAYAMAAWAEDYVADEGWIVCPQGTEVAAVLGPRDPSVQLEHPLPDLVRSVFVQGELASISAVYTGERARLVGARERSFADEEHLLAWLDAPARYADLWSLCKLVRVEPDEASRAWLDDLRVDALSAADDAAPRGARTA